MTEAPIPTNMSKGQSYNTNNATKQFNDTAIANRLRTVSWSNYSHPTGAVKPVYERSTFLLLNIISIPLHLLLWMDVMLDCICASRSCEKQEGSEQFKMKIYVSSSIRTSTFPQRKLT